MTAGWPVTFPGWPLPPGCLAVAALLAWGCGDGTPPTTRPAAATPTRQPTMYVTEGPDAVYPEATRISGTIARGSTPVSGGRLWVMVGEFAGLCAEAPVQRNGSYEVVVPIEAVPGGTPGCLAGAELRLYYREAPGEEWYEATQTMRLTRTEGGEATLDLSLSQLPCRPEPTP